MEATVLSRRTVLLPCYPNSVAGRTDLSVKTSKPKINKNQSSQKNVYRNFPMVDLLRCTVLNCTVLCYPCRMLALLTTSCIRESLPMAWQIRCIDAKDDEDDDQQTNTVNEVNSFIK